ncbi:MAG: Flp pilus assembly protein CpaB [Parvibaculum sp.]|uniref:Flp pilus assembly protein CpaB n=1 Tax=Parvibaculum sp. TaxID=2024848 RepID=UPI0025FFD012|nr:Flp pilus assembly protein CpaB [Parvibaculum sp.]MCE9650602.1 Flp pilus assembly protein CpaB [Parvibaculum sp.]
MGVLVLAVVAAGLAALLARGLVSSGGDAPAQPQVVQAPTTEVLVASTNIDRGSRLTSGDLRWQSWPDTALGEGFVTRKQKPDAIAAMTGSLARSSMANGEPVTEGKLVDVKSGGFMSALLTPGKRAVAIVISPETGAGGFVLPNDRVDIVQTRRISQEGPNGPEEIVQGEMLLQNIRVLAIDQRFKDDGGEQVAIGKTATVELTPAQAEAVAVAQVEGPLILSLRGLSENAGEVGEERQEGLTSVIRVVRYGAEKTVRVK